MAQKIREVMTPEPHTLRKSATLMQAAVAMRDMDVGGVVVTEDDGKICGFVTDRDIVVRGIAQGNEADKASLDSVCSRELTQVGPDDDAETAVKLMAEKAVRRIPVVDNGEAIGIVSLGDLAQARGEHTALGGISAAPPNR